LGGGNDLIVQQPGVGDGLSARERRNRFEEIRIGFPARSISARAEEPRLRPASSCRERVYLRARG